MHWQRCHERCGHYQLGAKQRVGNCPKTQKVTSGQGKNALFFVFSKKNLISSQFFHFWTTTPSILVIKSLQRHHLHIWWFIPLCKMRKSITLRFVDGGVLAKSSKNRNQHFWRTRIKLHNYVLWFPLPISPKSSRFSAYNCWFLSTIASSTKHSIFFKMTMLSANNDLAHNIDLSRPRFHWYSPISSICAKKPLFIASNWIKRLSPHSRRTIISHRSYTKRNKLAHNPNTKSSLQYYHKYHFEESTWL